MLHHTTTECKMFVVLPLSHSLLSSYKQNISSCPISPSGRKKTGKVLPYAALQKEGIEGISLPLSHRWESRSQKPLTKLQGTSSSRTKALLLVVLMEWPLASRSLCQLMIQQCKDPLPQHATKPKPIRWLNLLQSSAWQDEIHWNKLPPAT